MGRAWPQSNRSYTNCSCDARSVGGASRFPRARYEVQPPPPPREPTARAITSNEVISAAVACSPISALARLVSGIVSVGLKALELVVDRYR